MSIALLFDEIVMFALTFVYPLARTAILTLSVLQSSLKFLSTSNHSIDANVATAT
jgi:hypothetical protein